jgi:hypothetical protein
MAIIFRNRYSCKQETVRPANYTTWWNKNNPEGKDSKAPQRFLSYYSILPSTNRKSKWFFPSGFPTKTLTYFRSVLFLDVTQCWMVVLYRRFGTSYLSHLQRPFSSWTSWPLKMGPIGCPETSVQNYQSTLRNIADARRFHLACNYASYAFLLPSMCATCRI